MIKRMKYKPLPKMPPPKYLWYWEPFEWEEESRDMMIIEPKCPYCGKQMAFVSKHQDCDPLSPQCVIGFQCNSKKCGFYVFTPCKDEAQKEAIDFLLYVIEEEKEE